MRKLLTDHFFFCYSQKIFIIHTVSFSTIVAAWHTVPNREAHLRADNMYFVAGDHGVLARLVQYLGFGLARPWHLLPEPGNGTRCSVAGPERKAVVLLGGG